MLRERAFLVVLLLSGGLLAQNVVVNPTGNQSIVQPAGTTLSTNSLSNIAYVTASDNWSLAPTSPATLAVGANTITLTTCPRGLWSNVTAPLYANVYIATVGTPEAVPITATTCPQIGGGSGTITVTVANTHGAGYTVGSASQGVQEAINAASFVPNYSGGTTELGAMVIAPAQYTWNARVIVSAPYMTLDFSGSVVTCTMADTCLFVGNASHSTYTWDVTIKNFTGQAGCNNCNFPMIEDNAQKTNLIGISAANSFPLGSATSGNSFGSMIQIDNDQAAVIDRFSSYQARWYHCDTSFCSVAVKGAGGGGNSGVIYLSHANMNLNCAANGVDNQNSNTMRISDSVIPVSGAICRALDYDLQQCAERGTGQCLHGGGRVRWIESMGHRDCGTDCGKRICFGQELGGPTGASQVFANTGTTGTTQYNYYIVAHSTTSGGLISAPFLAGIGLTNGSAGNIAVKWPQFGSSGTITYDVIRTSGQANNPAPYLVICGGGSPTACGTVATGLTTGAACSTMGTAHICSFTDAVTSNTGAATSSNLPAATYYWPAFGDGSGAGVFWNGAVVYTTAGDAVGVTPIAGGVHFDRYGDNVSNSALNPVSQVVSSFGPMLPKFFAQYCYGPYGGTWVSCVENATATQAGATVLQSGGYNAPDLAGLKGRLIFEQGLTGTSIAGGHKITLVDSNPAKTLNTAYMRPT